MIKKIVSVVMTLVMLLSCAATAIPVSAAVEVDQIADYIWYKEAYYFASAPRIDGIISESEWGEPTAEVNSADAATKDDWKPKNNLYFHARSEGGLDTALSYKLWLRWDEKYFYIGVKVNDPDGHSLKMNGRDTWNGDAFQIRVDPHGPNAMNGGYTWHAGYTPDNKPWSKDACDLVFGYSQTGGGFSEAYDEIGKSGINSFANNPLGACKLAVIPCGSDYSADSRSGITTYEIAVPWNYIDPDNGPDKTFTQYYTHNLSGGIGREFGVSAALYNSNKGIKFTETNNKDLWSCFLTWGSGVDGYQGNDYFGSPSTCGGSNSVVLSDEMIYAVPTDGTEGGIPDGGGLIPDYPSEDEIEIWENLPYDDISDLDIWGAFTGGERVQLEDGNWAVRWDMWDDPNTGEYELNQINYLVTETGDGIRDYGGSLTHQWRYSKSFTFEFDIMVTGTEVFADAYPPTIYNWFGGNNLVSFACGYYFDEGKFKIVDSSSQDVIAEKEADFSLNKWHNWRFQYDNPSCTMRLYLDDELIFNITNRYFDYTDLRDDVPMILRRLNVQMLMDNVQITNFVDYGQSETPDTDHTPKALEKKMFGEYYISDGEFNETFFSGSLKYDNIHDASYNFNVSFNQGFSISDAIAFAENLPESLGLTIKSVGVDNGICTASLIVTDVNAGTENPADYKMSPYLLGDLDRYYFKGKMLNILTMLGTDSGMVESVTFGGDDQTSDGGKTLPLADANGDGRVASADIVIIKKYFANPDMRLYIGQADANDDSRVTSGDILLMKKVFAGIEDAPSSWGM